jgi:Tol biopolymer transport system component
LCADGDGGWRVVREITDDRAIEQWPAWSPDGRWLLWVRTGAAFPNVYAVPVTPTGEAGPTSR